jgi:hypothetical protein
MTEPKRAGFQVVPDDEPDQPQQTSDGGAAFRAMMLALSALSQKTIIALSNLFALATVGSVFWLAMSLPKPDVFQLIELGMYSAFVLAANFIVRRR